jgi:xeroderma pigmentosum group C-complementing protein
MKRKFLNVSFLKLNVLYLQFHRTFCVTAQSTNRGSFESNLAFTIQDHVGTAEEVLKPVLC